jgi:hypothetical protein
VQFPLSSALLSSRHPSILTTIFPNALKQCFSLSGLQSSRVLCEFSARPVVCFCNQLTLALGKMIAYFLYINKSFVALPMLY